jgi:hypothetical protein
MNQEKQHTLLGGLSYFGLELLRYLNSAADSALTWGKVDFSRLKYIVSTLKETEINVELCRIIRDVLVRKLSIIILTFQKLVQSGIFPRYLGTAH